MDFMGKLVLPPENVAVRKALENLVAIGAIKVEKTGKESLTPLGKHLPNLPVDARIRKLLVWASCFGCLSPALTIAAALSGRSIFKTGPDQQNQANIAMKKIAAPGSETIASGQQSDHLMAVAGCLRWLAKCSKLERRIENGQAIRTGS
ncbi:hypothetical protein BSKO_10924 [Bryopsis sp. KO-2023]|nr:hypothetical protein BSKO_10924 [Bryopsis sp. KO-2023]